MARIIASGVGGYTAAVNTLRHRRRPIAWLALCALLAWALLPTLSHAFAPAGGKTVWSEVCTPQGMRLVAIDAAGGETPAPVSTAGHLEHCPYCAPTFGALGLPPALLSLALPPPAALGPPPLFLHAPRTLFAWTAAQPRAPPALT